MRDARIFPNGSGIFEINDIASSPMTIYRNSKGIENTVCYTVKAISSNIKAAAGFADINAVAWRSDDDMASVMGAASNIQDTTDIDYCASDSNIIARTGSALCFGGRSKAYKR